MVDGNVVPVDEIEMVVVAEELGIEFELVVVLKVVSLTVVIDVETEDVELDRIFEVVEILGLKLVVDVSNKVLSE